MGEVPLHRTATVTLNYPELKINDTLKVEGDFRGAHGTIGSPVGNVDAVVNQGYPLLKLKRRATSSSLNHKLTIQTLMGSDLKITSQFNQNPIRVDSINIMTNPKVYQIEK